MPGMWMALAAAALLAGAAVPADAAEPLLLQSPGGKVAARIALDGQGRPTYSLSYAGRALIAPSALGLAFERYRQLSPGMAIEGSDRSSGTDAYSLIGKRASVSDPYSQLVVRLAETGGEKRRLEIHFRAYEDGFAFRYRIPPWSAARIEPWQSAGGALVPRPFADWSAQAVAWQTAPAACRTTSDPGLCSRNPRSTT